MLREEIYAQHDGIVVGQSTKPGYLQQMLDPYMDIIKCVSMICSICREEDTIKTLTY